MQTRYFLPYNAAVYGSARIFSDTWGVADKTYALSYSHSFSDNMLLDFHQDLFEREDKFNFMARDKQMSTFNNVTVGLKEKYLFKFALSSWAKASSITLSLEHIQFDYDNFSNVLI